MKTILKMTLVIAFAALANASLASGNLIVKLQPVSNEKAVMNILTLTNSHLSITVTDEENRIVYFNETTEPVDRYRQVYNFSDLESGVYKLTVKSDDLTSEQVFEKNRREIVVGKEKTTLKPYFGYQDGMIKCTYLNFPKENVKLRFFEKTHLIFSKEIGRNFNVCGALNVSKLGKGEYVAILSAGDKEYMYPLEIK